MVEYFKHAIEVLYLSSAALVLVAFIPQIKRCLRSKICGDISILAWSIFVFVNFNALLYGIFILNDPLNILLCAVQVLLHALVLSITIYKRK